ncbi:MAG: sigma-70 family RNA polymerase sigma factor [Planctomycetes bacterium]|nr:sigma-70 family RNA polymerase sigma factor [Planctomycetota bacterium]
MTAATLEPCQGLFSRLAAGDPAALDEVCRRYGPRAASNVRRPIGRPLRARVETADLAQEAMLAVVRDAPRERFESEAAFLRWLQAVVERRVLRAARRWGAACRSLGRERSIGEAAERPDPRAERPSQVFAREEEAAGLAAALARLAPGDREVFVLRLVLELPWAAVAGALGTTEECAQMRFLRARKRLAAGLG